MGVRGEIFSTKVMLTNRTYFFNVKENRMGDLYLNVVESKNRDNGGFERQSVILFADDLQEFLKGFEESLRVLEKAVREKNRGKESPKRESFNRESPRRENFNRDSQKREGFNRERPKRENFSRDSSKREDFNRERPKRENFSRDGAKRENPRRRGETSGRDEKSGRGKNRQNFTGEKPARSRKPQGDRRVVVKKREKRD